MIYLVIEYPAGTDLSAFIPGKIPITVTDGAVTVEKGKVSTTFTLEDSALVIPPHTHSKLEESGTVTIPAGTTGPAIPS